MDNNLIISFIQTDCLCYILILFYYKATVCVWRIFLRSRYTYRVILVWSRYYDFCEIHMPHYCVAKFSNHSVCNKKACLRELIFLTDDDIIMNATPFRPHLDAYQVEETKHCDNTGLIFFFHSHFHKYMHHSQFVLKYTIPVPPSWVYTYILTYLLLIYFVIQYWIGLKRNAFTLHILHFS